MNTFETVIGIEIHIELNTKTKMFSPAPNKFNEKPNTLVHPIDVAYPGTLPRLNKEAVVKAIKLAKALNMEIDTLLRFDRKNYFYPDLPKSFQITQQNFPIGKNGTLTIESNGKKKEILIERIHLEEDTAKQIHLNDKTLVDYNRAGVPLIEIVTKPIISNAEEAANYVDMIRKIVSFIDISDAKMSEGSLRADVNISIRPFGQKFLGEKVEIKNLNSVSNLKKAIEFEKNLQIKKILSNEKIESQTKRFDESKNETVVMRTKSKTIDYKYIPEPNIPFIRIPKDFIDKIKVENLPWNIEKKLLSQNISSEFVQQFLNDFQMLLVFESIIYPNREKLSKVFFSELISLANSKNVHIKDLKFNFSEFVIALKFLDNGEISGKHLKTIINEIFTKNEKVEDIVSRNNLRLISDEDLIFNLINKASKDKNEIILEYPNKPEKVLKYLTGFVMKETEGQANPVLSFNLAKKYLDEKFKKV
ncbi:Asp-tRNA(Asn)/Glu-tRNA(Gln) amidotransferase subunit GatB [[Mycoplasma] mobile]|uniref:Aspartyl/glutamyl-tRNA(Asn/Gln) amidotransferase subunit B n=1 Tax=Mycoplasma mobile (strain ATCC 43663 / 163K / NCTC 11711) TaxID=267748 RepID=GATB_MYCM1|nr:Asp-tRNA(Asn)/Glu-tRNA(Gln) amidotransferase subunit GatB [[Mycoplasma] mobile]Q6KHR6.1 RecName: Full=Aspartyl/glutamyl-tRNA(Asn/Gln) amidotransferase subunit B; Short=Asp/Glu-ADT subunit B [Mycoplasma mobile 163K]AAT27862.1 glutamyl-tRNA amidotransferase subunit B [Mycoplasma mobile 163K]